MAAVVLATGLAIPGPVSPRAQTVTTLGSGLSSPMGVAADRSGNVFIADSGNSAIKEITVGDPTAVKTIAGGFGAPLAVAVDHQGDIFAIDSKAGILFEMVAEGGYATVNVVATGRLAENGVAVDANGDVFYIDGADVKEATAASSYRTIRTIATDSATSGIAVDKNGNVFVIKPVSGDLLEFVVTADNVVGIEYGGDFTFPLSLTLDGSGNAYVIYLDSSGAAHVKEFLADGGYTGTKDINDSLRAPRSIAVDASGNLFVANLDEGIAELSPQSGYAVTWLGAAFAPADALALDSAGDLFFVNWSQAGVEEAPVQNGYSSVRTIDTPGFSNPSGIAIDASGNLFVADRAQNAVKEIVAAGGYTTIKTLGSGIEKPSAIALDSSGNVFVADIGNARIKEITVADGYATVKTLGVFLTSGLALDPAGNLYLTTQNATVTQLLAQGDYTIVNTIDVGVQSTQGIAFDSQGNMFLSSISPADPYGWEVAEVTAASGYTTTRNIGSGLFDPNAIAVDQAGNLYVADTGNNAVKEISSAPPVLFASVLPGSRSVVFGTTATMFATMINSGETALDNCQIQPGPNRSETIPDVTFSYQATDPVTNVPVGKPNTPVAIAGANGSQSFLLSFDATRYTFSSSQIPLEFACTSGNVEAVAPIAPGVDTLDLSVSVGRPDADIIALAQTASGGIVGPPAGGAAAFAVATTNLGDSQAITVSADTGAATLPVSMTVCQTDSSSGQCLSPPSQTVSLNFAGGADPTFSVFIQANGEIAFDPANARIFVRFNDTAGAFHGSTSVAIETR
jgi:sugar lactone lactonase YvrE